MPDAGFVGGSCLVAYHPRHSTTGSRAGRISSPPRNSAGQALKERGELLLSALKLGRCCEGQPQGIAPTIIGCGTRPRWRRTLR